MPVYNRYYTSQPGTCCRPYKSTILSITTLKIMFHVKHLPDISSPHRLTRSILTAFGSRNDKTFYRLYKAGSLCLPYCFSCLQYEKSLTVSEFASFRIKYGKDFAIIYYGNYRSQAHCNHPREWTITDVHRACAQQLSRFIQSGQFPDMVPA